MSSEIPAEYEVRAVVAENEYEVRAHAARPVLTAITATAEALPPGEPRTLLLYLVEDERLFNAELTCGSWFKACRIHRAAARDVFQSLLGVSPATFLEEARLEVGVAMLAASDLTVTAIGQVLGFGDTTFERVFESHTGSRPAACRPWLRELHAGHGGPGLAVLSRKVLQRLCDETAPVGVYRAVTRLLLCRYFEHMSHPDTDVLAVLESRLAADLWELRLSPNPNREVVEACRVYFKTTAFDDFLAAKGYPPPGSSGCRR